VEALRTPPYRLLYSAMVYCIDATAPVLADAVVSDRAVVIQSDVGYPNIERGFQVTII
jgi:hypothetical protein